MSLNKETDLIFVISHEKMYSNKQNYTPIAMAAKTMLICTLDFFNYVLLSSTKSILTDLQIIVFILLLLEFVFFFFFLHQRMLMVFLWSLSDSKSPQVSRTLSILVDLSNATVWMVGTRPLISKSSSPCTNPLVTVPSAPITIGIVVNFMFHSFFSSLARFWYIRGAYDKFPDFFRIGTFIDSTHIKL